MSFHVGQMVVCVDDKRKGKNHGYGDEILPVQGCVYTIRGFIEYNGLRIYLEEIINAVRCYNGFPGGIEPPFYISRFRPVRKTDISIFTNMLAPTPKEKIRAATTQGA